MHPAIRKLARESGMTLLAIALYGTALAGIGLAVVEFASRYVWIKPAAEIVEAQAEPAETAPTPAAARPINWIDGSDDPALRNGQVR